MKKKVVTEDNYKQIVLKRMICLCWVILLVCFVIKIFGGNFFAYIGKCKAIETIASIKWLLIPIQFILYCIGTMLYFLTLFNNKHISYCIISTVICGVLKQLIELSDIILYISLIVEAVFVFVVPAIIKKDRWYDVVIMGDLLIMFQTISMFTKNICITDFPYDDTIGFLFLIDYYIMLALVYLYSLKGGIDFMKLGLFFLSTNKTQLEEYKKLVIGKYDKKVAKLNLKRDKKVAKINAKIEKVGK